MTEVGGLLRNILPCLPCSSAQTPQHRQGQQQQRWRRQDGNTLSLEKIPCYKRTKQVSWTWHTLCVGLLDKNHYDKEQDDQQGANLASFSPSLLNSSCLFVFQSKWPWSKNCVQRSLGQLFVYHYLFGWQLSPTRPFFKHLNICDCLEAKGWHFVVFERTQRKCNDLPLLVCEQCLWLNVALYRHPERFLRVQKITTSEWIKK